MQLGACVYVCVYVCVWGGGGCVCVGGVVGCVRACVRACVCVSVGVCARVRARASPYAFWIGYKMLCLSLLLWGIPVIYTLFNI